MPTALGVAALQSSNYRKINCTASIGKTNYRCLLQQLYVTYKQKARVEIYATAFAMNREIDYYASVSLYISPILYKVSEERLVVYYCLSMYITCISLGLLQVCNSSVGKQVNFLNNALYIRISAFIIVLGFLEIQSKTLSQTIHIFKSQKFWSPSHYRQLRCSSIHCVKLCTNIQYSLILKQHSSQQTFVKGMFCLWIEQQQKSYPLLALQGACEVNKEKNHHRPDPHVQQNSLHRSHSNLRHRENHQSTYGGCMYVHTTLDQFPQGNITSQVIYIHTIQYC